jgi:Protein of unknown function (DUF4236)
MPFYLRKSVSAGPFRFNFSKGGIGVSVGVKGFRLGTGPRGHYVHAGRGGVYYRGSIGRAGRRRAQFENTPSMPPNGLVLDAEVEMVEVESGDVQAMLDEEFSDVLDEINRKGQQIRMASLLGWGFGLVGLLALISAGPAGAWLTLLVLPGLAIGRWLDSYRRSTVIFYDLEPEVEQSYRSLVDSFDHLSGCAGKWHIEAGGAVQDLNVWKRHAGATHLIQRKPTTLTYRIPDLIKSNVTPPALHVGKQIIYFLPDVVLVEGKKLFGAVGCPDLQIRWQESNFIEDGSVPSDAKVIGYTWKYPNKSGGPDRRFNNNYQIPLCRYEVIHLTSKTGLNELVELSKTGVAPTFAASIRAMSQTRANSKAGRTKLGR